MTFSYPLDTKNHNQQTLREWLQIAAIPAIQEQIPRAAMKAWSNGEDPSTYGKPGHVGKLTHGAKPFFQNEGKMPESVASTSTTADPIQTAYPHYFKDVRGLEFVDVYRVLLLFGVTDPCIQHAIKKLLCSGGRGAKSAAKDVDEAIVSLKRWSAMRAEENRAPEDPNGQG